MEKYNPDIEIHYLQRIAEDNFTCANILASKNHILTTIHLMHESLEKYLKVLWLKNNSTLFNSKEELFKKIKGFNHDILKIVDSLPEETKQIIEDYFKTPNLLIYKLNPIRFAEESWIQWSEENYLALKKVIENIRDNLVSTK